MNQKDGADAECNRRNALRKYHVLNTPAEEGFDELTRLAAHICGTPMALVSFVDGERLWVKSRVGCELKELSRSDSICNHVLESADVLVHNFKSGTLEKWGLGYDQVLQGLCCKHGARPRGVTQLGD